MEARPRPEQPRPEVVVDTVRVVREVETVSIESMIQTVYFDYDSAQIPPAQQPGLWHLAEVLQAYDQLRVRLEGHASREGAEAYNDALSQRRAYAVMYFLLDAGVREEQLTLRAYGEHFPERTGETEEAAALNRRVDIYFQVR